MQVSLRSSKAYVTYLGADLDALDRRRLRDYLTRVVEGEAPNDHDIGGWEMLLRNLELMEAAPASM